MALQMRAAVCELDAVGRALPHVMDLMRQREWDRGAVLSALCTALRQLQTLCEIAPAAGTPAATAAAAAGSGAHASLKLTAVPRADGQAFLRDIGAVTAAVALLRSFTDGAMTPHLSERVTVDLLLQTLEFLAAVANASTLSYPHFPFFLYLSVKRLPLWPAC
jgi:hypothetical protein